jgi:hypothetical protein
MAGTIILKMCCIAVYVKNFANELVSIWADTASHKINNLVFDMGRYGES